jgi:tetratricopeptide (TPR) repeat protein
LALQEDDRAQAKKLFQEAIDKAPKRDDGYLWVARVLRFEGQYDQALETLKKALSECEPTSKLVGRSGSAARQELLELAAELSLAKNDLEASAGYVDQIRQLNPNNLAATYISGKIAFLKGQLSEARQLLEGVAGAQQKWRAAAQQQGQAVAELEHNEAEYRYWLSLVYEQLGVLGKAQAELVKCRELVSDREPVFLVRIRLEQARVAILVGDKETALREANWVLEAEPKNPTALMIKARALIEMDRLTEALAVAKQFRDAAPQLADAVVLLAEVYSQLQQPAQAEQTLLDGLGQARTKTSLYETLIRFYQDNNMKDKLPALVQRLDADQSPELTDQVRVRLKLLMAETTAERRKILDEESKKRPDDPVWLFNLGLETLREGHTEEGLDLMTQAYDKALMKKNTALVRRLWDEVWLIFVTSEDPERAKKWIDRLPPDMLREREMAGALLELMRAGNPPAAELQGVPTHKVAGIQLNHVNKAIAQFDKLLTAAGSNLPDVRILRALARAHFLKASLVPAQRVAEFGEAEKLYSRVIDLQPQDVQSRLGRATVYLNLAEYERAVAEAADILSKDPRSVAALEIRALARQGMAAYDDAARTREQIRKLAPANVANLMVLAQLCETLGRTDTAEEAYRDVIKQSPKAAEAIVRLAVLLYSKGAASQGPADAMVDKLVAESENKADALARQTRYLASTGRPERASEKAKEIAALHPNDAGVAIFVSTALAESGHANEAIGMLEEFLKKSPDNLAAKTQLSDLLMLVGRPDGLEQSERLVGEVLKETPDSLRARTILARLLTRKAEQAAAAGKPDDAGRLFDRADQALGELVREMPDFGEAYLAQADLSYAKGQKVKALDFLRRVRRSDAVFIKAVRRRVDINLELGDANQARSDLVELLGVEPRDVIARLGLADLYGTAGQYDDAERVIKEGLDRYTRDNPALLRGLVKVLVRQNKASESRAAAERLTRLAPEDAGAWDAWAEMMTALQRGPEAAERLKALAESHKDNIAFNMLYVDHLCRLGRFDDASKHLEGLSETYPKVSMLPVKLAEVLISQGVAKTGGKPGPAACQAALKVLADGLARVPGDPNLMHKVVSVHELAGQWAEGEQAAREIAQKHPRDYMAWVQLSECLLNLKKFDQALEAAKKAVDLESRQASAWNNMAWILVETKGDLDLARNYVGRALALAPNSPAILDTAAWIEYLRGDYQRAIDMLEPVLRGHDAAVLRYHLGLAYILKAEKSTLTADKQKAAGEAKKNLSRYLELDPAGEYAAAVQKLLKGL